MAACLAGFCAALGLDVSAAKTQTMCFGLPADAVTPTFTYRGRTLPTADSYKYLGVTFTPTGSAADGLPGARSKLARAHNSVRYKVDRLGCAKDVHLHLHLFDAVATQTALSGCELWGVHPAAEQQRHKLAALHRKYIKDICGLPNGVCTDALMKELGRSDIETRWLFANLRFWNNLCAQPAGSLHFELLMDAQCEALLAGTKNWVTGLRKACRRVGFVMPLSTERAYSVDIGSVMKLHARQLQQAWEGLGVCPRSCPSQGAAKCKYERWMARTPRQERHLRIFRQRQSWRRMKMYLRFRLGCSLLPVVVGQRNGTARQMRYCQ